MEKREVVAISLTLKDGTQLIIDVPEGAAFYRQGYTFYTTKTGKVEQTLWTNEVFWTYTTEGNTVKDGPPRPSKTIRPTESVETLNDLGSTGNGKDGSSVSDTPVSLNFS